MSEKVKEKWYNLYVAESKYTDWTRELNKNWSPMLDAVTHEEACAEAFQYIDELAELAESGTVILHVRIEEDIEEDGENINPDNYKYILQKNKVVVTRTELMKRAKNLDVSILNHRAGWELWLVKDKTDYWTSPAHVLARELVIHQYDVRVNETRIINALLDNERAYTLANSYGETVCSILISGGIKVKPRNLFTEKIVDDIYSFTDNPDIFVHTEDV